MSKGKIVLISCLMLIPILFKKFLNNLGWNLTPEALIYLLLGFGSFLVITILVTSKEARKYTTIIPIVFVLLFVSVLIKDHKTARAEARAEKQKAAAAAREAQAALPQKWQQEVILAQQHEGVLLELPEEGWYVIQHSGGKIFDNRSEYLRGAAWDIWGGGNLPKGKAEGFLYQNLESQQLVINPDGKREVVIFPEGERTTKFFAKKFVVLERNEYVPLLANGEHDYASIDRTIGQWTFVIRKEKE